jgi:N-acetylneuraminic acid mutarotase
MKRCLLMAVVLLVVFCGTMLPCQSQMAAQSVSTLPIGRSNMAVVCFHDQIYCLGGNNGEGASDEGWLYDPYTDKYADLPPMPHKRYAAAAAVCGQRLLVCGGLDENDKPLASVDAFDLQKHTWSEAEPMPSPRARFGLAVLNGQMYVAGGDGPQGRSGDGPQGRSGDGPQGRSADVFIYDVATRRWQAGPPLPRALDRLSLAPLGGSLYAMGGQDAAGKVSPRVWKLRGNRWDGAPDLRAPRCNFAAVRQGRQLIVAGGWTYVNSAKVYVPQIESLVDGEHAWQWQGRLPRSCDGCRAVSWRGRVLVFGGYDEDFLTIVQECRFVPPPERLTWGIDPRQKVQLGSVGGPSDGEPAPPAQVFNAATEPDNTDLTVAQARLLGWLLPPAPDNDVAFIKLYEFPSDCSAETSLRRATAPFLIGESVARAGVLVDKIAVAPRATTFGPRHPFPAVRVGPGEQDAFDRSVIFATLYVTPARAGAPARQALEGFDHDLTGLLERAYVPGGAGLYTDDSDSDQAGDDAQTTTISVSRGSGDERMQVRAEQGSHHWMLEVVATRPPQAPARPQS